MKSKQLPSQQTTKAIEVTYMDTRSRFSRPARMFVAAIAAMLVFAPGAGRASQLTLASSPLFLTVPVPPNIFFLDDDSGSMDWDMLTNEGQCPVSSLIDGTMSLSAGGNQKCFTYIYPSTATNIFSGSSTYGDVLPEESTVAGTSNMPADNHGVWRGRYYGYNKMYYNPDVNYLPWPGVDSAGINLPDAKAPSTEPSYISAFPTIRWNPYDATSATINITQGLSWTSYGVPQTIGSTIDLSNTNIYPARYYTWTDSNSNGVIDSTDAHTLYEIRASADTGCSTGATCPSSFTRASTRTDCTYVDANTRSCTRDQELKNFANWFMYHRRHQQAAKYAIGKVIDQAGSEVRMGHATINNNAPSNSSRVLVQPMSGSWTTGNKKAILDALYKVQSNGSTPLRTALDQTGRYFECVSGNIFGLSAGSASCPILSAAAGGTCQQNFAVLVTDGFWNDSFTGVGNADGDASSPFDNTSPNIAYGDGASNTLADVAMHYYERDLAPSLSNAVPVTAGVDNNTMQHMVTYGVAFGVSGTLSAGPSSPTVAFPWPDPTATGASDATKIDDLRHAAYNGRGQFLSAQDPDTLATALLTTLGSIGDRTGSSASVAVNSRSLSTSTRLYQARFTSGEWSGDLRALAVNASGDVSTLVWSTKDQIKNQDWNTGRAILTRNDTIGIPFRWTTSGANALTTTEQAHLNTDPVTNTSDSGGNNRLNWLRGDSSNEGTGSGFRVRANGFKLGDIVNSSPIFVGAPIFLPQGLEDTPHLTFRSTYGNRREMVYVGANDGMLHGFDAATGQEKIAYVPSMLFNNSTSTLNTLNQLTNPSYTHRYYVDGSPTVSDAYGTFTNVSGVCSTGCWRTVLVGGLAGGGKGVYALDVTDPDGSTITGLAFNENNAASIALWEYTDSASGDMGYVYGQPTIAKVRNGSKSYAWAAIFGNGYNSANENAALYIVNVVTGALIQKIVLNPQYTGWGTTANSNGLAMPAVVDTNGDYIADAVYAGDLRGNLWKVDLTADDPNKWGSAYNDGSNQKPLFKAVDGSGNEQPITVQPEVGNHPDGQSGYMVYFGTGRYIVSGDNAANTSPVQTFYGIWDQPYKTGDATKTGGPVTRADLAYQTFSDATVGSITVRQVTNSSIQWRAKKNDSCSYDSKTDTFSTCLGWRDDLMTASSSYAGEKAVSNPVLVGGTVPRIMFTTLIPQTDPCTAGGTSPLIELNPKNGGRLPIQVFDINGDGTVNSSDMIGGTIPVAGIYPGIGIMPEPTILRDPANKQDLKAETGSSGAVMTIKNHIGSSMGGRQSWRQLK